ncbi:hypothetical protein GCM10023156_25300 [Novipirellula rosea]|uniref:Uncharacterized protein n=1 Tax=Novipirellula rosea TaxID=1031540 RepID=A0ABP8MRF5_9BACT
MDSEFIDRDPSLGIKRPTIAANPIRHEPDEARLKDLGHRRTNGHDATKSKSKSKRCATAIKS